MTDPTETHRCSICHKTYKRREHLVRHLASHTAARQHSCASCGATFHRTDVLKRHAQTCEGASASSPSTNRRRACDRCVRQKRACSMTRPCHTCKNRGAQCQYSSTPGVTGEVDASSDELIWTSMDVLPTPDTETPLLPLVPGPSSVQLDSLNQGALIPEDVPEFRMEDFQGISFDWIDFLNLNSSTAESRSQSLPVADYRGCSFDFLYRFTSQTGFAASFDCASSEEREQVALSFQRSPSTSGFVPVLLPGERTAASPAIAAFSAMPLDTCQPFPQWLHDPIVIKLQHIILRAKEVITIKPRNSTVTLAWSVPVERKCLQFFSPTRVTKFLELYWSIWHPNVNFLHRPTFDPTQCKSILLAAMALIGEHITQVSYGRNQDAYGNRCLRLSSPGRLRGCENVVQLR